MSQEQPKMFLYDFGGRVNRKESLAARVMTPEELAWYDFLPGGKKKKKDEKEPGTESSNAVQKRGGSKSDFVEKDHPRAEDGKFAKAAAKKASSDKKKQNEFDKKFKAEAKKESDAIKAKTVKDWIDKRDDFTRKHSEQLLKTANSFYDQADDRLKIVKKMDDKLAENAAKTDIHISKSTKSIKKSIAENNAKAEELLKKADAVINRAEVSYPVPFPAGLGSPPPHRQIYYKKNTAAAYHVPRYVSFKHPKGLDPKKPKKKGFSLPRAAGKAAVGIIKSINNAV